ncbi:UbiA family prenyltransferase [Shimia ponticola]|uniref:UbiA family prenyltransferase n=1 Tax=Shimia ponticola TaxID=2582893 RepID=UPI0011BDB1FC|nr:UbiA family prenyltransferase [Shimia ponticola]
MADKSVDAQSLIRTNLTQETIWAGLGQAPIATLRALAGGRRGLTQRIGAHVDLRTDLIPVQSDHLADIRSTGASVSSDMPKEWLHRFANQHGLTVSDAATSTKPMRMSWKARDLIKALRPHQWVKNILLILPMIAAHDFTLATLSLVILGIIAFSAAASAIYIVNDLLDLEADRLHPTKCKRPFAAGTVPLGVGMATCLILIAVALAVGTVLGAAFFAVVCLYMIVSLAYSLKLKRMRWVDIATLAALYTIRVVAGAAASQVEASAMMLIFIFPIFITLGCVKRLTELTLATSDERLPGRGYGRTDRGDLLNVAGLGIFGALLVFGLYTFSEQALILYPTRWILWLAMVPMAIWMVRMVVLGYRGKQDYDPIVFAMRDKTGIGILMITLSLMFYAAGLWAQWFGLG